MRNSPGDRPVLPSVLDRLIDLDQDLREDPSITRAQSIRDLKASLQRDLEWLLNTRLIAVELPESSEELRNSLFSYGLPEFRELNLSTAADRLSKYIEAAIKTFEPRLANVRVSMRPREGVDRIAHFMIEAFLLLDPMPERVTFDTVLELTSGEYRVEETAVRDDLLAYYERELTFLRQMGAQFGEKYPKIASRLSVEADRCEDPHVERLLEGFAFLAARVHLKIDDEFPEITDALLNILYPHYLRPIPSMSVAEFQIDPEQNTPPEGLVVPKGAVMHSRPVDGLPFKFRSCYDVTLWPMVVSAAQWTTPDRLQPQLPVRAVETVAALRVTVQCTGAASFDKLQVRSLRFHLNGESNLAHTLYELLCSNCTQIYVRDPTPRSSARLFSLDSSKIRPVGFGEDEDVIPYPGRSFLGYRLLQEYFSFPEKFFFIDIQGLDQLASAGFTNLAEIVFLISPFQRRDRQQSLEVGVSERTLRLGCSPIVNLAAQTAEPILLSHTRYEYPVVPDVSHPKALEVFSVDEVVSADPRLPEPTVFSPFYSHKYGPARDKKRAFWHAARRPSTRPNDDRSEVYISLVDLSGRPTVPNLEALTVRVTCTNSDLPAHIPFGNERGDLELQGVAPVKRIAILRKPSNTVRPPLGKDASWRLISHLSLNYLSLVDEGKDALQNVLRLYNFADSPHTEKQIQGITKLRSARRFARVISEHGISFGRGTTVEMELDEDQFVGGGVYLFSSVLEHFFGLYVSMNSFCELIAQTVQRKEVLKHWQPRAGKRILV